MSIVFDTPEGISYFRLVTLRSAVKLESIGMKAARGLNATKMARKEYGLKARAPHAEVLAVLDAEIARRLEARAAAASTL